LAWAVIRGTWADSEPRDPRSSADGIICQLYKLPDGKTVRTAVVLDASIDKVWEIITDYKRYQDIFPTLSSTAVTVERVDDERVRLSGMASSILGTWPFKVTMRQKETAEERSVSWDEPASGDVLKNRGSFVLKPLGGDRTLLVYSLEVELVG